jgi:DNA-binding IclR family transcriptional regulator
MKHGGTVRREITSTPYYDRQVTRIMDKRGINRSEAYRYLQALAEGRTTDRHRIGHLVTTIKNEALTLGRNGGRNAAVDGIVRAATEILALL